MQELWFLHSAYPLMLVDICMKFHDASLYFQMKNGINFLFFFAQNIDCGYTLEPPH